jgi:hypothetical protein
MVDGEVVEPEFLGKDAVHIGIGGPDKALEVPGAGAADARLGLRQRQAEVGGIRDCRLA